MRTSVRGPQGEQTCVQCLCTSITIEPKQSAMCGEREQGRRTEPVLHRELDFHVIAAEEQFLTASVEGPPPVTCRIYLHSIISHRLRPFPYHSVVPGRVHHTNGLLGQHMGAGGDARNLTEGKMAFGKSSPAWPAFVVSLPTSTTTAPTSSGQWSDSQQAPSHTAEDSQRTSVRHG